MSAGVLIGDQAVKYKARQDFKMFEIADMTGYGVLSDIHSPDTFLQDPNRVMNLLFIILALVISAILIHWLHSLRSKEVLKAICISLTIGGGVSNALDYLLFGGHINISMQDAAHWLSLNLADAAITLGLVIMVLNMFVPQEQPSRER